MLPAAVVFTAADQSTSTIPCRALDIEVDQVDGMYFVDAPTLHAVVTAQFNLLNRPMSSLPLSALHTTILAQHGVAHCSLEPTLGGTLRIRVGQQRPIARVWMPDSVLYLDEAGDVMPLSRRYTADVPIVHAPDLNHAKLAIPLLETLDEQPFWDQFVDQVEVNAQGQLFLRPRVGDMVVELGSAASLTQDLTDQLQRLKTFYTELIRRGDLRQYRSISLQYDGQLVAAK